VSDDKITGEETVERAGHDETVETVTVAEGEGGEATETVAPKRKTDWSRVLAYGVLPALALLLVIGAGVLKILDSGVRQSDAAREEAVQAAKDSAVAMLTYKPDTVEEQLTAARERLTGDFRQRYTDLTNNVVIPGAKEKQISAVASVPGAAPVSADPAHAVVMLFISQTVTVGTGVPSDTASSVRVTLDKIDGRWLISQFEPL